MRRVNLIYLFIFLISLASVACGEGPHQPLLDLGENKFAEALPGEKSPEQDAVKYSDVKPIFQVRCSRCHPAWSPPNWLDYAEALKYVQNGRLAARALGPSPTMPMIGTPEASDITAEERALISEWVNNGGME